MEWEEVEMFQKIRVKPKVRQPKRPEWQDLRVKRRKSKTNMQEYFMNTHNRRSKDYA